MPQLKRKNMYQTKILKTKKYKICVQLTFLRLLMVSLVRGPNNGGRPRRFALTGFGSTN